MRLPLRCISLALLVTLLLSSHTTAQNPVQPRTTDPTPPPNPALPAGCKPSTAPPKGPTATGGPGWTAAFTRAQTLLATLSLEEKVNLTTGVGGNVCTGQTGAVPSHGLRSLCLNDGTTGLRGAYNVSQFPSQITLGATWNRKLAGRMYGAMAGELRGRGVNVLLGPVTGGPLGRAPLSGRTWESFGFDEYLHGELGYTAVESIQAAGVIATAKHWVGYEQETLRNQRYVLPQLQKPLSSDIDDKTLHQLYAWPFAEAIRAGAGMVMCAYNRLNGSHACENDYALNHVLKTELGFQGAVVSDYGAVYSLQDSVDNGMDMLMPGDGVQLLGLNVFPNWFGKNGKKLLDAVCSGKIGLARIDDMVARILTPVLHYLDLDNLERHPMPSFNSIAFPDKSTPAIDVQGDHATVIRKAAREAITLLKNVNVDGRGLPLDARRLRKIAVVGQDAVGSSDDRKSCNFLGMCRGKQGTRTVAEGSGYTFPPYVVDPLSAIRDYLHAAGLDSVQVTSTPDSAATRDTANEARDADVALVFADVKLAEALDRTSLSLDAGVQAMIKAVADANRNTVVVLHSPAPVILEEVVAHANVSAVLYAYYPGQESGNALTEVLFGDKAPSGKLPFVIGKAAKDWPPDNLVRFSLTTDPRAPFREGTQVDWKWFDTHGIEPRFPFGFGLSYTTFEYRDAKVVESFASDNTSIQPTNEAFEAVAGARGSSLYDVLLTVSATLSNTGERAGKEVAQLYVGYPDTVQGEAAHVLRGFFKTLVLPQQSKEVRFGLRRKDLSVWDPVEQRWMMPRGRFSFYVAGQSMAWDKAAVATFEL